MLTIFFFGFGTVTRKGAKRTKKNPTKDLGAKALWASRCHEGSRGTKNHQRNYKENLTAASASEGLFVKEDSVTKGFKKGGGERPKKSHSSFCERRLDGCNDFIYS